MPELNQADLAKLMQDNLARSEEILTTVRQIKTYMFWQQVWAGFRFFLIAIPVVLGVIYLPPLIKDIFESYRNLLAP